jgi:hypothetical protein
VSEFGQKRLEPASELILPSFSRHQWKYVTVSLTTHALGGLTRHDLRLAARIEGLVDAQAPTRGWP